VIVVNYNVREFLDQALASVLSATAGLRVEVIVVDNDSVDGSAESVRNNYPHVRLIANTSNIGFGAANNQAIEVSSGEFLLILNPDTIIQEDTLETLVDFMQRYPDAGAVGCKILNPDGTFARESRRAFPTPRVASYRITGLSRLFPRSPRFGRYNMTYLPVDEVAEVDALSGSCMMIRRTALCAHYAADSSGLPDQPLVRLFDEDFFMYGEDLDLCYRIQAAGWKIYYTPETQIIHYKGESTRKGDLRYVRLFYGAMLHFADKHFTKRSRMLRFGLRMAIVVRATISVVRRTVRRLVFPALDLVFVYASVVGIAALWPATANTASTSRFLLTIPLIYAAAAVASIRLAGGYERTRQRFRPVAVGLAGAFAFTASLSFFIKAIAFSRLVIAVSLIPAAVLLFGWRIAVNKRNSGVRRAIVVGDGAEAVQLEQTISSQYRPPFVVAGYVENETATDPDASLSVRRLGSIGQLRDVIRINRIDDVIFATSGLSNRTVLSLMQSLRDLPVEFKTLVPGGSHVIGKARVEDLSVPLVPSEITHGRAAGFAGQKLAHRVIALIGILLWPIVEVASAVISSPKIARLRNKLRMTPRVLSGKESLVGFLPHDEFVPPDEWRIKRGLFSVSETLPIIHPGAVDLERAWLFYMHNRSISLDIDIIARSLRRDQATD
jgi:GT2 family glycosyltransferase